MSAVVFVVKVVMIVMIIGRKVVKQWKIWIRKHAKSLLRGYIENVIVNNNLKHLSFKCVKDLNEKKHHNNIPFFLFFAITKQPA